MFDEKGYIDFDYIINNGAVYNWIVGGRGTGKTFGAIKYVIDHNINFVLLRRTQVSVDLIKRPELNPFKALERVLGDNYSFKLANVNKYITAVYRNDEPEPCGHIMALSTIAHIRGYDSDAQIVIYDEFIPEEHERPIKAEGRAVLNALETIGRNRELEGRPPLPMIALANSNNIVNPVFVELGLVSIVEKMIKKAKDENPAYMLKNIPAKRSAVWLINNSPVAQAKQQTALYQLAGGGEFSDMALHNRFADLDTSLVRSCRLKEYKPVVVVGELCIYVHKFKAEYYVSTTRAGSPPTYSSGAMDLVRFAHDYYFIWLAYLSKIVFFETYLLQALFEKYYAK